LALILASTFLLSAIESHLENEIASKLKNYIYVDNLITCEEGEAINLYRTSKLMLSATSMNLRELATNNGNVKKMSRRQEIQK
jgi:hypothetical protein